VAADIDLRSWLFAFGGGIRIESPEALRQELLQRCRETIEANDTQVKLAWYFNNARGKPRKKKIIGRVRGYHGVTVAAGSMTGIPVYHADFDVPLKGFLHAECPHFYRAAEPGETEADFEHTLAVAATAEYDYAYTFIFSPREGTQAAAMEAEFVAPAVASERFQRLRLVVERSALRRHEARVGRIEEVLVEGPSKRDPAVLSGRTRQNKLVHFVPPRPLRTGSYATVRITRGAPHFLEGEFVEFLSEPTHKLRIPVAAG